MPHESMNHVLRHYNEQLISQLGLKGVSDFYSKSPYIEMWRTFFRIMFEPALVASNSEQARQFMSIMNAINDTHAFLTQVAGFSKNDAANLISIASNVRVNQIVDTLMGARVEFSLELLEQNGYKFDL